MRKFLLLASFIAANVFILLFTLTILIFFSPQKSLAANDSAPVPGQENSPNYSAFAAVAENPAQIEVTIGAGNAKARIIDAFYARHQAPMTGLGHLLVGKADKYNLPFNLLPAISWCESNGGRVMPDESKNPFGYGIYVGRTTKFISWEQSFETVARGLRLNYFDKGLTTPNKIMKKYTPGSLGSWADCVTSTMDEIQ